MKSKRLPWTLALVGMMTIVSPAAAQGPDVKPPVKSALAGLPGVYVHLTEVTPAGPYADVSPKFLRQTVEDRLREAGIRLLSREELSTTPGAPILEVQFCLLRHETLALYQYSIETVLWEKVSLERDSNVVVQAVTWRSGVKFGSVLGELLAGRIQDVFDFQIGRFIHDYELANPDRRPAGGGRAPEGPGSPSPNDAGPPELDEAPPAPDRPAE